MLLRAYGQDYLDHITHERRLARKTTVTGYANYLRRFLDWLESIGHTNADLSAFTTATCRRYLYALSEQGLRPRSIRGRFHPIIGLGAYLVENGVLETNPAKALTMPKKDAAQRALVSDEEVALLWEACERLAKPRDIALARALLGVLIFAGLRREELLCLRVDDVNFADRFLLVRSGKGSKSRTVYVPDECLTALREWIPFRPKDVKHDWLWARDRSRRIYESGLVATLRAVKAAAGLANHANIMPHSLRHAYASRLMRHGADVKSIQAALGHAHMATTAIYLHLSEEQGKQVANLASLSPKPAQPKQEANNVIDLRQRAKEVRLRRIAQ